jgi:hypothetical protein
LNLTEVVVWSASLNLGLGYVVGFGLLRWRMMKGEEELASGKGGNLYSKIEPVLGAEREMMLVNVQ